MSNVTLAQRFVAKAAILMPHMADLQDLDLAINDANHIDEIMFRRSEYLGGMANVICAVLEQEV